MAISSKFSLADNFYFAFLKKIIGVGGNFLLLFNAPIHRCSDSITLYNLSPIRLLDHFLPIYPTGGKSGGGVIFDTHPQPAFFNINQSCVVHMCV